MSKAKLYTNDTLIYTHRGINATYDAVLLQKDHNTFTQVAQTWLMSCNANKYVHLTITCKTSPICVIQQNNSAKCLVTDKLSWSEHITNISNKAISISELSCSETWVNANSQSSQPVKQHNYIYVPF